jgi:hypothetical protein
MLKLTKTIFITAFIFSSCIFTDTGTNTLIKESINKTQTKKAILFLKEAGATVADSYQVMMTNNNHKLDKGEVGNTFTVDTNHGDTWLNANSINFTWLNNDTLQIDYDKKLRTFIKENKVDNVTIIYKPR